VSRKKHSPEQLQQLLSKLVGKRENHRPLPTEFLEEFTREVGGIKVLARLMATMANDPKTPQMVRQRLLGDILRLMFHVEMKSSPPADLTGLEQEDLEAALGEVLRQQDGETQADAAGG
jgi:hypothetical protein